MFGLVVPDVLGRGVALVLAIRRRRSPDGLQRQQHQQEECDPATHAGILQGVARPRVTASPIGVAVSHGGQVRA
jgi:hypothetical protein